MFFNRDPELKWTKVTCPFCHEPTGSTSKCYEMDPANLPAYKKHVQTQGMALPLFSVGCAFRKENMWIADINYPASQILVETLSEIEGVDRVRPTKPYAFEVVIGGLFSEQQVKRNIVERYKSFIISLRLRESENSLEHLIGIRMPNGRVINFDNDLDFEQMRMQMDQASEIVEKFPDAELIFAADANIIE